MRKTLAMLVLVAATAQAQAISRYESTNLSCAQAQERIAREGAVILRYRSQRNPSLQLYDRYVASGRWCEVGEYARLEVVPTADTQRCQVLRCFQRTDDDVF